LACVGRLLGRVRLGRVFFEAGREFWFRNSLVLFLFLIFFQLINIVLFVFTRVMISGEFGISVEAFRLISTLISFVLVVGIGVFLTFSNFFVVVKNLSAFGGVRSSIGFVKREYLATLSLSVILFVIVYLVGRIGGIAADLISYVLVLPFAFLVLTRFVVEFGK